MVAGRKTTKGIGMASVEGTFRAWRANNGIALVLVGPSGDDRRFIVNEGDLRGELHAFLIEVTEDAPS